MPVVECKNCGQKFHVTPSVIRSGRGKYCSVECSYIGRRRSEPSMYDKNAERTCKHCNKKFVPSHQSRKYCSDKCSEAAKQLQSKRYERQCVICGKKFRSSDKKQLTCGRKCGRVVSKMGGKHAFQSQEAFESERARAERIDKKAERLMKHDPWKNVQIFDAGSLPLPYARHADPALGF